jgi:hypothetical protein
MRFTAIQIYELNLRKIRRLRTFFLAFYKMSKMNIRQGLAHK